MKPRITFKCSNEQCEQHGKEMELHYSSIFGSMKEERGDDYWTARLKHCRSCYKTGEVKIEHGNQSFSSTEAFEEYVIGVAKEARLLKKLVNRGVAEPMEREQLDESMKLLRDTKCPCCGKPLLETVNGAAGAQPSTAGDAEESRA